ncbi:hypothetical protein, partial [Stenotrophomonas sp. HMWF023]
GEGHTLILAGSDPFANGEGLLPVAAILPKVAGVASQRPALPIVQTTYSYWATGNKKARLQRTASGLCSLPHVGMQGHRAVYESTLHAALQNKTGGYGRGVAGNTIPRR